MIVYVYVDHRTSTFKIKIKADLSTKTNHYTYSSFYNKKQKTFFSLILRSNKNIFKTGVVQIETKMSLTPTMFLFSNNPNLTSID